MPAGVSSSATARPVLLGLTCERMGGTGWGEKIMKKHVVPGAGGRKDDLG